MSDNVTTQLPELYGTEHLGTTVDDRLGKCYEIAGYALMIGDAPSDAKLVHGSMHHVRAPRRIGHAWLELADGRIWEPIGGTFYDPLLWEYLVRGIVSHTYDQSTARARAFETRIWGPWEENR